MSDTGDKILAVMARHGLTVESVFVPFSQSRNKAETYKSLNWRVTLGRWRVLPHVEGNGENTPREVVTCDYSAGSGHCPAHKLSTTGPRGVGIGDKRRLIAWECENGRRAKWLQNCGVIVGQGGPFLKPEAESVMASLILNSSVLDYANYEQWSGDMGYDPDSRKGESIYRACLEIALKLRNGLGESIIAELREACQDY